MATPLAKRAGAKSPRFPKEVRDAFERLKGEPPTKELVKEFKANGWKYENKGTKQSKEIPFYTSPCGQFLIKLGMTTSRTVPALAIPSKTALSGKFQMNGVFEGWILQPKADVSNKAVKEAWSHFKN